MCRLHSTAASTFCSFTNPPGGGVGSSLSPVVAPSPVAVAGVGTFLLTVVKALPSAALIELPGARPSRPMMASSSSSAVGEIPSSEVSSSSLRVEDLEEERVAVGGERGGEEVATGGVMERVGGVGCLQEYQKEQDISSNRVSTRPNNRIMHFVSPRRRVPSRDLAKPSEKLTLC